MQQNKPVCLITGASSGIGKELAYLEAKNSIVILVARRVEKLQAIYQAILAKDQEAYVIQADVSKKEACHQMIEQTMKKFGRIDRVIANAGMANAVFARSFNSDAFEQVMKTNFMSLVYTIEAVMPCFLKQNSGHIVAISSMAAFVSVSGSSAYHCSKASMAGLMDSIRREFQEKNIKTTLVHPGFIKSDMTDQNDFFMPLLMPLKPAVKKIHQAIIKNKRRIIFPKIMYMLIVFIKCLPLWLQDKCFSQRYTKK